MSEREFALQAVRSVEAISIISLIVNSGLVGLDIEIGKVLFPISIVLTLASVGSEIYIRKNIK